MPAASLLIGYHGTDLANVDSILTDGYQASEGDDQWFGNGVYFFIKGLSSKPAYQAEQWAIVSAYDGKAERYRYREWGVIESTMDLEENVIFDLNKEEQRDYLTLLYRTMFEALRKYNSHVYGLTDGMVINYAIRNGLLNVVAVLANVYIKLDVQSRKHRFNSRVPNCTICAVRDTTKIIDSKLLKNGRISS